MSDNMPHVYVYHNEDKTATETIIVEHKTLFGTLCYCCQKNTAEWLISHEAYYYEYEELLCDRCYSGDKQ